MKGEFSRSTFSARMRYGSVTMQQGRVQLDTDWDEMSELQINGGLVYLDVWERDLGATGDASLGRVAVGGPDTGSREKALATETYGLRMIREVERDGHVSSTLHAALGRATSHPGESFVLPELEVSVEGVGWKKVSSFSGCGPRDEVFVVKEDGGRASIQFGDGLHGARPEAGSRVVASYRYGNQGLAPEAQKRRKSSKPAKA